MPFTGAHPLAVLPLVWARARLRLDATCLVIGSMAPDLEYFARGRMAGGKFGHTPLGLVIWCVPITLVVAVLYHWLVKWPTLFVVPTVVARRAIGAIGGPWRERWGPAAMASVVVSALLGAITHVAWDSFTHEDGFGVLHIPALAKIVHIPLVGHIAVHRIMQLGCSVVGLAALAVAIVWTVWRQPPIAVPEIDRRAARWIFGSCIVGVTTMLVARVYALDATEMGDLIVAPVSGVCAGLLVASLVVRGTAARFRAATLQRAQRAVP